MFQNVYFKFFPGCYTAEVFWSQPAQQQLKEQDLNSEWWQVDTNITTENTCKWCCGHYYSNPAGRIGSRAFSSALLLPGAMWTAAGTSHPPALGLALSCTARTWAGAGHCLFGHIILLEKWSSFYIGKVRWKAMIPSGRLPLSIATAFV